MRYESIPRKIMRWLSDVFKYMKEEFGNWAYIIAAGLIALIYKPLTSFLSKVSDVITYAALGALILLILYWIYKKIIR